MQITRRDLFTHMAGAAGILACVPRPARAARRVRIGHVNPPSSQLGQGARAFADAVAQRLGDVLQVEVHGNGSLGGEQEMVRGCTQGTIDFAFSATVVAGNFAPEAGILEAPFLFRSEAHARAVLDGPIGGEFAEMLKAKDVHVLAWGENGIRHFTANKPIRKPEDLRGLKVRVPQSQVMMDGLGALGAAVEALAFPQVYEALRTGRFDAQENPVATIEAAKFNEVQSHLSLTGHIYSAAFVVASPDIIEDLTAQQRDVLAECARIGARASREAAARAEQDGIGRLKAAGMTVVDDVDRAAFGAASQGNLDALGARFDKERISRIQRFA